MAKAELVRLKRSPNVGVYHGRGIMFVKPGAEVEVPEDIAKQLLAEYPHEWVAKSLPVSDTSPNDWDIVKEDDPTEESAVVPKLDAAETEAYRQLVNIPGVGAITADKLWNSGVRSLEAMLDPVHADAVKQALPNRYYAQALKAVRTLLYGKE